MGTGIAGRFRRILPGLQKDGVQRLPPRSSIVKRFSISTSGLESAASFKSNKKGNHEEKSQSQRADIGED